MSITGLAGKCGTAGGPRGHPPPGREFSVRKDYHVLIGTNRHTITPTGWVQEENNLKLATDQRKYLAREYGVARYERIRDADFAAETAALR